MTEETTEGVNPPEEYLDGQQMLDGFNSYKPRPVMNKLRSTEHKFINYVEQYYHQNNGQLPTPEQCAFALRFSLVEIQYFLQNRKVITALGRRGIDGEALLSQQAQTYLSSSQIACAVTVANFADTRPVDEKIESLGISSAQYYAWLKNTTYKSFVTDLADQALDNIRPEAVAVFSQLVRAGDVRALKMYFDMTGAFQDNSQINDLKMTLQHLIESVQRHVKDPDKLAAIAADLHLALPSISKDVPVTVEIAE